MPTKPKSKNIKTGNPPGNSKQRKQARKLWKSLFGESEDQMALPLKNMPQQSLTTIARSVAVELLNSSEQTKGDKLRDALALASFAFTAGAWGWSVISPDTSAIFGSVLLFLAVAAVAIAAIRMSHPRKALAWLLAIVIFAGYGWFDWRVVIEPQRGKPFKELLIEGYNVTTECEAIPARTEMPQWMRDQSKQWQARMGQLIATKLSYRDLQMWSGAIVIGRVEDENMNAYQCLWLSVKLQALETIIANNYDPSLKHRDYNGPTYWLNVKDGKADISEALKDGKGRANIYFNSYSPEKKNDQAKPGDSEDKPNRP